MGTGDPDPYAEKLSPDTPDAERPGPTLAGFLADGPAGYKRLYVTARGDAYLEFPEDAAAFSDIPPDQYPFLGEQATLVQFRLDARLEFTYRRVFTADEFDLRPRRTDVFAGDPSEFPDDALGDCPFTWFSLNCTRRRTCR